MATEIGQHMRHIQQIINELHILQSDQSSNDELTEEYGLIKFDNDEIDCNTHLSHYIRLALNTSPDKIIRLIKDGWHLSSPNLIISITGGANNFLMSPKLRKIFQQGLIEAAVTTNAWIITAGTNVGVVKEVGQAIENYRYTIDRQTLDIPIIGIASWNYTQGKQLLRKNHVHSQYSINSIQMDICDEYFVRSYVINEKVEEECDLESHHTHFLLFDDGQLNNNPNIVLPQRAQIEKYLTFYNLNEKIPLIMILVEGGSSSIKTICQALLENTPVLVIQDSGRAANIVSELYKYFINYPNDNDQLHLLLSKLVNENQWFEEVQHELCEILKEKIKFISIYQLNGELNFEDAILQTLFNATKCSDIVNEDHQHLAEMKLAINWNKIDYAKINILNEINWKEDDLIKCLLLSLINDNIQFVDLLIQNGVLLNKLTYYHLKQLYSTTMTNSIIEMKKSKKKSLFNFRDDFYRNYFQEKYLSVENLTGSSENNLVLGQNAANRLFIWSISVNRFNLSKYLLSKIWNPTIGCLLAAKFYEIASNSTLDLEKQKLFLQSYSYFDKRASEIIDQCFDKDEQLALDIIKTPGYSFENFDSLQIAGDADLSLFLASKSVQKYLDNKWYGKINYNTNYIKTKIFLTALIIPLLPIFAIFLPFIQKHKKILKNEKDKTKNKIPIRIDFIKNSNEILSQEDKVKWSQKFIYFYQSPIVRFYYYGIFFVLFLILFSYVLLVDYYPLKNVFSIGINELIVHICLFSFIVEEVRQFILLKSTDEYFGEIWNKIDLVAFILYLISLSTRFILNEHIYYLSKICLCLSLILWYIRLLHYFAAYETLGPKLVMIYGMMKDLIFFVCFIIIFLFGFSVSCFSLIGTSKRIKWIYNPNGKLNNIEINQTNFHFQLIQDLINFGFWKIFAQVDPIEGTDILSEFAYILTIFFVAIANILLLNVLIALFNVTIQNVENRSYTLWRYQRFLIINEFSLKSPIPPPFNYFYYLFLLFRCLIQFIRNLIRQRSTRINNQNIQQKLLTNENIQLNQMTKNSSFKITDTMKREYAIADYLYRNQLNKDQK